MSTLAFLQNLSSWEIVLIFMVVLLFFGAKRLPELFRSLGKSVKEFKSATSGIEEDIRNAMEADEPVKKTPKPASKSVEASATDAPVAAEVEADKEASTEDSTSETKNA
ncbi:MAG: twin-arginine translocase TatA/TatE family subunit [Opitutales bacterium]|jgi:sec-independent protein translocase protein TatA|nr:twin-arginine translocase TatA/TatE family subunit [Opitutales bacterium]MDP4645408.1 twin-arginine translocase TatA/TatE family subunit [Opitutales bacterium]MDP4692988.1 twin-arginine translocase TatA/TatE family subunit [Opitutales bacterium]MDP4776394.1 twin-arginine translocase TatA/TatE family subunit [Opitutales bacterium]MDP4883625.1 twin-arginine translocase TatA/TatE family subunit [Opitutales bacterium]